jgi:hypothetical protein
MVKDCPMTQTGAKYRDVLTRTGKEGSGRRYDNSSILSYFCTLISEGEMKFTGKW